MFCFSWCSELYSFGFDKKDDQIEIRQDKKYNLWVFCSLLCSTSSQYTLSVVTPQWCIQEVSSVWRHPILLLAQFDRASNLTTPNPIQSPFEQTSMPISGRLLRLKCVTIKWNNHLKKYDARKDMLHDEAFNAHYQSHSVDFNEEKIPWQLSTYAKLGVFYQIYPCFLPSLIAKRPLNQTHLSLVTVTGAGPEKEGIYPTSPRSQPDFEMGISQMRGNK